MIKHENKLVLTGEVLKDLVEKQNKKGQILGIIKILVNKQEFSLLLKPSLYQNLTIEKGQIIEFKGYIKFFDVFNVKIIIDSLKIINNNSIDELLQEWDTLEKEIKTLDLELNKERS